MTHYLSWAATSLQSVKAIGGRLFLDENAELVYSFQTGNITAYSIAGLDPAKLGTMAWSARSPASLGYPVRGCVALSMPVAFNSEAASRQSVLAILQGNDVVHLLDVNSGQSFIQALPPTNGRLLGFMWTSCANAQFVIVTTLGLKCFTLGRQALHSGKSCKALEEYANADLGDVVWYKYQHHTRILIMATQFHLSVLQITGQRGITRLKRFNLSKIYGSVAAAGAVGPRCLTLLRTQADVPGGNGTRIYICVVNASRQAVHVLSLSAAEVTYVGDLAWPVDTEQQLERDLLEEDMRFSVFDNLIVMHCLPLGTAAVYDFLLPPDMPSDGSNLPLFQPLLLITGAPKAPPESTIIEPTDEQSTKPEPFNSVPEDSAAEGSRTTAAAGASTEGGGGGSASAQQGAAEQKEAVAPGASALFMPPCHAVDMAKHTVYRLQMNLKACLSDMRAQGSNRFLCLCERSPRLWPWLRDQQIGSLRDFLLLERDLAFTQRVFDSINFRYKGHFVRVESQEDLTCLSPSDVVDHVLCWLHEHEEADNVRLEALVSLYGLSARSCGIVLPTSCDTLLLKCIGSQMCHTLMCRNAVATTLKPCDAHAHRSVGFNVDADLTACGKAFQAGLMVRGMSSTWRHPTLIQAVEDQAPSGLLGNLNVFCARLWSRLLLSHNATGAGRVPLRSSLNVKAQAVDGYVRCLLKDGDVKGAAAGLRDVLGPHHAAAQQVLASAASEGPLIQASVSRCCPVTSVPSVPRR